MIADAVLLLFCVVLLAGLVALWIAYERLADRVEFVEDWRAIQLHGEGYDARGSEQL